MKIEQPLRITTTNVISSEVQLLKVWEIVKFIENKGHSSKTEFWPIFTTFSWSRWILHLSQSAFLEPQKRKLDFFWKLERLRLVHGSSSCVCPKIFNSFFFFLMMRFSLFFWLNEMLFGVFLHKLLFFTTTFTFKEWKLHVAYYNSITQKILSAQKLHKKGLHFLLTYYAYCYL